MLLPITNVFLDAPNNTKIFVLVCPYLTGGVQSHGGTAVYYNSYIKFSVNI